MNLFIQALTEEADRAARRVGLHERAGALIQGDAAPEAVASYYVSAHEAVKNATSLLCQSHDQLKRQGGDPALIELLGRKCTEEAGHDHWLEADLQAIGFPLGGDRTPAPSAASRLYTSFHREVIPLDGHAFLGTAFVLESLAMRCAGVAARNLEVRGQIPGIRQGLSFLHRHHEEDIGHVAELARVIDAFVTSKDAQDYVLLCARFTGTVYADFF